MVDEHAAVRLHPQQRLGVALIVRNLFDESNVNWLSSTWYDDVFDDQGNQITVNADRFDHPRTLQRPRTISLSFTKKW